MTEPETVDAAPPIAVGSTIQLNSGGPIMTVVYISSGQFGTQWFCQDGYMRDGIFHPACVRHIY